MRRYSIFFPSCCSLMFFHLIFCPHHFSTQTDAPGCAPQNKFKLKKLTLLLSLLYFIYVITLSVANFLSRSVTLSRTHSALSRALSLSPSRSRSRSVSLARCRSRAHLVSLCVRFSFIQYGASYYEPVMCGAARSRTHLFASTASVFHEASLCPPRPCPKWNTSCALAVVLRTYNGRRVRVSVKSTRP